MASARTSAGPERRYRQLSVLRRATSSGLLSPRDNRWAMLAHSSLVLESDCRRSGLATSVRGEERRAFCSVCPPPATVGATGLEVRIGSFSVASSPVVVGPCAAVLDPSLAADFVCLASGCVDGRSGSDALGTGTFSPMAAVGPASPDVWSASAGVLDVSTVLGSGCGPGGRSANQMPTATRAAATAVLARISGNRLDLVPPTLAVSPGSGS